MFTVTKNKQHARKERCVHGYSEQAAAYNVNVMNLLSMLNFLTATPVYTKLVVTGETESPIDIHKSVNLLSKGST